MKKKTGLSYVAYLRKSEEREDRQVLSLPAQRGKIREQFPDFNIVEFIEENSSAFKPGRPLFNALINRIEKGEIQGIIGWHPNRLSRNEIDSAKITYMLRGQLKDLKFCTYNFDNSPEGIMMLQLVMNQSQYESSKQGRDVKRGMEQKAITGERPGVVPQGYMKTAMKDENGNVLIRPKDQKVITRTDIDPVRYPLIRKMWEMLLSGTHTGPQILKIATEEWGFTTRKSRRMGGKPLTNSGLYRIFNNPYYAGYIVHNGELHKGNHKAMITLEEFDYVQSLLGKHGKPRIGTHHYAFTGMIRCGICDCQIVAKTTPKYLKGEQRNVLYVHYYCTRKSVKRPCNQIKYTRVEVLEQQIEEELAKYTILPEFRDLALKILRRNHKLEVKDRSKIYEMQQKRRSDIQQQLDKLVDLRTRDLMDDEEYTLQRNRLKIEQLKADEMLKGTEQRADKWFELMEAAFDFATYASIRFKHGSLQTKRQILMTLGENLVLKDNRLQITPNAWLIPLKEAYPGIEADYLRVRTDKKATSEVKQAAMNEIMESWRARRDLNPRHPA